MADKIVEIDEAELLRLRRTGETVSAMIKSPTAKRKLLEALKDVRPDDPSVKELERPDPVEARFDELTKANADLKKQIEFMTVFLRRALSGQISFLNRAGILLRKGSSTGPWAS